MINLRKITFEQFIFEDESSEINEFLDKMEVFFSDLDIDQSDKILLSNMRSEYGLLCKEYGFYKGYDTAIGILRQMLVG